MTKQQKRREGLRPDIWDKDATPAWLLDIKMVYAGLGYQAKWNQAQRGAEKAGDLNLRPAMVLARKARNGGQGRRGQRAFSAGGEVQFWRSAVLNRNRCGPIALPSKCVPEVASSMRNV